MLFALVLVCGIGIDMAGAKSDQGVVFFEELRQIEIFSAVVGLLIEIHCADTNLGAFEVGGNVYDEIVGTHVAEQADEAAFVEFNEFFCDAYCFEGFVFHPVIDKHIAGQSNDVLLYQCISIDDEVHAIGR